MEKMYEEMIIEHENSIKDYEQKKATYSEFVRSEKEKALMEMAGKIQQFNQNANQQLQQRNMELLQPVYKKINAAIEKVAMTNNFTYILDLSNGSVAYYSPSSENINPLVLKELNITIR
jgi:outer membrane protein